MNVDKQLISGLEKLARLQLNEPEREKLSGDLTRILSMVEKLNQLDTDGVAPLVYLNEQPQQLRDDIVRNQLSNEQALQNAPEQDGRFFLVPKVID